MSFWPCHSSRNSEHLGTDHPCEESHCKFFANLKCLKLWYLVWQPSMSTCRDKTFPTKYQMHSEATQELVLTYLTFPKASLRVRRSYNFSLLLRVHHKRLTSISLSCADRHYNLKWKNIPFMLIKKTHSNLFHNMVRVHVSVPSGFEEIATSPIGWVPTVGESLS